MGVPAPLFAGPLNRGRLVKIPLKGPVPPFVVGLCTRADAQMTPVAAALVRAIADVTQPDAASKIIRVTGAFGLR